MNTTSKKTIAPTAATENRQAGSTGGNGDAIEEELERPNFIDTSKKSREEEGAVGSLLGTDTIRHQILSTNNPSPMFQLVRGGGNNPFKKQFTGSGSESSSNSLPLQDESTTGSHQQQQHQGSHQTKEDLKKNIGGKRAWKHTGDERPSTKKIRKGTTEEEIARNKPVIVLEAGGGDGMELEAAIDHHDDYDQDDHGFEYRDDDDDDNLYYGMTLEEEKATDQDIVERKIFKVMKAKNPDEVIWGLDKKAVLPAGGGSLSASVKAKAKELVDLANKNPKISLFTFGRGINFLDLPAAYDPTSIQQVWNRVKNETTSLTQHNVYLNLMAYTLKFLMLADEGNKIAEDLSADEDLMAFSSYLFTGKSLTSFHVAQLPKDKYNGNPRYNLLRLHELKTQFAEKVATILQIGFCKSRKYHTSIHWNSRGEGSFLLNPPPGANISPVCSQEHAPMTTTFNNNNNNNNNKDESSKNKTIVEKELCARNLEDTTFVHDVIASKAKRSQFYYDPARARWCGQKLQRLQEKRYLEESSDCLYITPLRLMLEKITYIPKKKKKVTVEVEEEEEKKKEQEDESVVSSQRMQLEGEGGERGIAYKKKLDVSSSQIQEASPSSHQIAGEESASSQRMQEEEGNSQRMQQEEEAQYQQQQQEAPQPQILPGWAALFFQGVCNVAGRNTLNGQDDSYLGHNNGAFDLFGKMPEMYVKNVVVQTSSEEPGDTLLQTATQEDSPNSFFLQSMSLNWRAVVNSTQIEDISPKTTYYFMDRQKQRSDVFCEIASSKKGRKMPFPNKSNAPPKIRQVGMELLRNPFYNCSLRQQLHDQEVAKAKTLTSFPVVSSEARINLEDVLLTKEEATGKKIVDNGLKDNGFVMLEPTFQVFGPGKKLNTEIIEWLMGMQFTGLEGPIEAIQLYQITKYCQGLARRSLMIERKNLQKEGFKLPDQEF